MIPLIWGNWNSWSYRADNTMMVTRGDRERDMGNCFSVSIKLQLYKVSSKDLLYNIVPIVDNKVLCTLKFVKMLDLLLSDLNTYTPKRGRGHKKSSGGDRYITWIVTIVTLFIVYICPKSPNCIRYVQFFMY